MEVKEKKVMAYGRWPSPITPELITKGVKQFMSLELDGNEIYWGEMRPSEKGRTVVVHKGKEITPPGFNVRTKVHEYGGAPFTVHNGTVYFVNFGDQRLYKQQPGEKPQALTEEGGPRFADMHLSPHGIYAIAEQHTKEEEPENFIALINPNTGDYQKIVDGHDFFTSPVPNSNHTKLAWVSWDHPNMPWDTTELWTANIRRDGQVANITRVCGGKDESVISPKWGPDGTLYFISDRSGWWNLYRWNGDAIKAILPMEAEFGLPHWVFGMTTYEILEDKILATYKQGASSKLALIDLKTGTKTDFDLPETSFGLLHAHENFAVYIAGSPTLGPRVVKLNLKTGEREVIAKNDPTPVDSAYYSIAKHITFPSADGRIAHGYYYAPHNKDYRGPDREPPPLIVKSHGGPTANTSDVFSLKTQYWTSRGFAVLDVDYGGSTGYGRPYRQLLNNAWGIVDREDVEYGARYLVKKGLAHPNKLAITGGSAGGYTTLGALTFGNVFTVGASYYGVSDLEMLTQETHKFESRYLDNLVGPYPEKKNLYIERSPSHFPEKINAPVIFFQGLEDAIVPPNQAEMLYKSLKKNGLLTRLVTYEGEQHGFRQEKNIRDALTKELEFYLEAFEEGKK